MRLSEARSADENDVGFVLQKRKAEQILNMGSVDLFGPCPIELFEVFDDGEACGLDSTLSRSVFSSKRFAFGQAA